MQKLAGELSYSALAEFVESVINIELLLHIFMICSGYPPEPFSDGKKSFRLWCEMVIWGIGPPDYLC